MNEHARNAPCPCGSGKKYKRCCGQGSAAAPARPAAGGAPNLYGQALQLYRMGNLSAAAAACEQLLRSQPAFGPALELSAGIALGQGEPLKAVSLLLRQLELEPNDAVAHCNAGMALHALGRDEEAYSHLQQALAIDPKLAEAYNHIGNIHRKRNNLEEALQAYEQALKLGGADPLLYVNAGLVKQLLGDLETAEARYRRALQIAPGFPPALNNLGVVLKELRRFEEAQALLEQLLRLQPENPEVHSNLGSLWQAQGKLEKAHSCFKEAIRLAPNYVGAYINLALLAESLGDPMQEERCYDKALELDPGNATANTNLGLRMLEQGEQGRARDCFTKALQHDPNYPPALAGMARGMVIWSGKRDEAVRLVQRALRLAPRDPFVQQALAEVEEYRGDPVAAEAAWRQAIELRPDVQQSYVGLAELLFQQQRSEEGRAVLQQAEEHTRVTANFYTAWSGIEEQVHNLEAAVEIARKAAGLDPDTRILDGLRARLAWRDKKYDEALRILEQAKPMEIGNKKQKTRLLFEYGRVLDKVGRYPEAFTAYDEANRVKNELVGMTYDAEQDQAQFMEKKKLFSSENWRRLKNLTEEVPVPRPAPLFIVGFPRSGTTLLEQILGAHPHIAAAGELNYLIMLAGEAAGEIIGSDLPYPGCLLDPAAPLDREKLEVMRRYYLDQMTGLALHDAETRWISDKMPHNLLHLGLIALLFPESPIIHISRHPLDTCLSAFFANFKTGHRYTSSLEDTARHYRQMMELLAHYKQVLDMRLIEVRYQDLVERQEETVRKLLAFIGEEWDERCLQHHKSERVTRTASYEQVTRPVYRDSLARYQRYWEAVQPLIPILGPVLERYGYSVEPPADNR
jgi:tetratricopeptide (TPR) repeat protein